jgi:hypothetical protein
VGTLFQFITRHAAPLLEQLGSSPSEIYETDEGRCLVKSAKFDVEFTLNEMTHEITSEIKIIEEYGLEQEYSETSMIAAFFESTRFTETSGTLGESDEMQPVEVCTKVISLLKDFSHREFRDLHFFLRGFAVGYTDASR